MLTFVTSVLNVHALAFLCKMIVPNEEIKQFDKILLMPVTYMLVNNYVKSSFLLKSYFQFKLMPKSNVTSFDLHAM